eukprot:scaffold2205_cov167-Amphora_coffeaeformis.AAC.4
MMRRIDQILFSLLLLCITWPTSGFAAKKKGGRKGVPSSPSQGFGPTPPTFDEVVAAFKTRLGKDTAKEKCPCGSGALYGDCCSPYHSGVKFPEAPSDVLKTRYSAFYYRIIPYIISTTHPVCRDYTENKIKWAKDLNKNGMFDSFEFVSLQPAPTTTPGKDENESFLEFKVKLRARDGSGEETIYEKSRFLKEGERWLYASGEVRSEVAGLEDAILNP